MQRLQSGDFSKDESAWATCTSHSQSQLTCPDPWAEGSANDACKYAYGGISDGDDVSDSYKSSRADIVDQQIAKGGVRLAATLNAIFSS